MTTRLPGQTGSGVIKGLAKSANRLRHGRSAKYVDAGPRAGAQGGYSPMKGRILARRFPAVQPAAAVSGTGRRRPRSGLDSPVPSTARASPMPPRTATSLPRNLALAYALLIAYACLHPLTGWTFTGLPLLDYLVAPWPKYFVVEDLVFNVLGYLPLGFVAAAALPPAWPARRTIALATIAAALLSFGLETAQNFLPTRVSSNLDLGANTAGALLGAALGARWGHPLFDHRGWLSRWRLARVVPGHTGELGLILLGLWLLAQFTPDSQLFGSGDVRRLLGIPPPLAFNPERYIVLEAVLTATTLVAIGLFARCMMRHPSPWPIALLVALGIAAKTLAAAAFLNPGTPLAWLTPGAKQGLAAGLVLLTASLALPRVLQHALAGSALLLATALINLIPENPYDIAANLAAHPGGFLNFHGLTELVASLWPFAALAYLCGLGLWRGEHLASTRRL